MAKASRKDAHMTPTVSPRMQLTTRQRTCLEQIIRRQTSPQRLVRRAKILLALETGANECQVVYLYRAGNSVACKSGTIPPFGRVPAHCG